jgi:hypothetical protein
VSLKDGKIAKRRVDGRREALGARRGILNES